MTQPLVSIFMTTYNHELYIEEALRSCLNQTYSNIEIVISDDASSDNTPLILKKIKEEYPDKIKLNLNKVNLGLKLNANLCLSLCVGEYIAFFSGDDVMHSTKIERQMVEFLNNKNLVLCGHRMNYIDTYSKLIYTSGLGKKEELV